VEGEDVEYTAEDAEEFIIDEDMEVLEVEVLLWVCVEEFITGATIEAEEF
jgi:hypothetical protein